MTMTLKPRELRDWRAFEVECLENGYKFTAGNYSSSSYDRRVNRFYPDLESLLQGIAEFIGPAVRIAGPRPHPEKPSVDAEVIQRNVVAVHAIREEREVES